MRLKLNEAEKVFSPREESPGNMEAYSGQGKVEIKRNRWHFYFEH